MAEAQHDLSEHRHAGLRRCLVPKRPLILFESVAEAGRWSLALSIFELFKAPVLTCFEATSRFSKLGAEAECHDDLPYHGDGRVGRSI